MTTSSACLCVLAILKIREQQPHESDLHFVGSTYQHQFATTRSMYLSYNKSKQQPPKLRLSDAQGRKMAPTEEAGLMYKYNKIAYNQIGD